MKKLPQRLLVALSILLFASCGTSTTEPTATTEVPEVATDLPTSTADASTADAPEADAPEAESTPEVVLTVSEKISELVSNYDDDRSAFMKAYRKASTQDEKSRIRRELNPDSEKVASDLLVIVEQNPDDPATFEALNWVATNVRQGEKHDSAIEQLFDKYIEREELKDLCSAIAGGMPTQQTEQRLKTLIEKSPHDDVKGMATYTLAGYLARLPDMVEFADDPRLAKALGEDGVAYLKGFTQDDDAVEALYESVMTSYADVKGPRNTLLSERAEKALFALRYLAIGKVAPDIEGEDVDGESFKLSDYRGKVVMLDFWGDW